MRTDAPYRLGRTEQRGAVFGWRPGQAVAVAAGLAGLVAGVSLSGVLGAALGVVLLGAGVCVAAVPVRGRGLDQWAPVAVRFVTSRRRGALCELARIEDSDAPNGVIRWPDGTATSVARLRQRGLRALDDDPRQLGETIGAWLRGLAVPGAPDWAVTLLTVTRAGQVPPDARWVDPGVDVAAYVAVTARGAVAVASTLRAANVLGARDLSPRELAELLDARLGAGAGPLLEAALTARWRSIEGHHSVHAAFVVEEWPAGDVDEQVLAALCVAVDRRTVAVSVRVEEQGRARARTARTRTTRAADKELSRRGGFLDTPESSRDDLRDAERATELASGHASVRVVGVIALDADDVLELEAAAARLAADAAICGVRLRRCDGDHRRGLLASVPGGCRP